MKKTIMFVACLAMACVSVCAQISTGEPNASVIARTGNRPQKGDWGLYLGGSVSQVMDLVNYCQSAGAEGAYGLPLVNLKYYCTDNFEFRMGFQFAAKTEKTKTIQYNEGGSDYIQKTSAGTDYTRLLPGIAYHFNSKNLLDVYVGAQLPIGFNSTTGKFNIENAGVTTSAKIHQGTFVIGGGLFIGLQFFIADLPIAIGVEGGYSGQVEATSVPSYSIATDGTSQKYKDGTATTTARWGADASLHFSYYFNNK